MSTQEGAPRLGYAGVVIGQRPTRTQQSKGMLALLAALLVTALGVAAYGIFSSVQGAVSKEEQTLVRTAEAQTGHLNAQAEAFAAGANLSTVNQIPAVSPEALEAYATRWDALGAQFTETVVSPEAIEAYANRWAALTPNGGTPQALDAYSNRWVALGEAHTGIPAVSPEAIETYGARWVALGEQFTTPTVSPEAIEAYGARWAALTPADGGSPQALEAYGERWVALGEAHTGIPVISPEAIEAYGARWAALGQ